MKKTLALLLVMVFALCCTTHVALASDISVFVDGEKVEFDVKPTIVDSRTMVPVRKTAEILGAEVTWDDSIKTATVTLDDRTVKMALNDPNLYINDIRISMDTSAIILDSRILIPIRYLAEALDGTVMWDASSRSVEIITNRHYVTIDNMKITMGDPISSVVRLFGEADRIDQGVDRFDWHVYNSNPSRFLMIGVLDSRVISIYTAFSDFLVDGQDPDLVSDSSEEYTMFYDHADGSAYGVWVGSKYSNPNTLKQNFAKASQFVELQVTDITNAFRQKNGLSALEIDKVAVTTCRKHSVDMATNNFFSHTNNKNESPWDRYEKNGGKNYACTESISRGDFTAQDIFDSWMNSADHRANLLHQKAALAGVGMAYNKNSEYQFYTTQMFSYPN